MIWLAILGTEYWTSYAFDLLKHGSSYIAKFLKYLNLFVYYNWK